VHRKDAALSSYSAAFAKALRGRMEAVAAGAPPPRLNGGRTSRRK
jgi:hypothetical protein